MVSLNTAPDADAGGPYSGNEGSGITLGSAAAQDPDGDPLAVSWSVDAPATCSFSDSTLLHPELTCDDNGSYTVTLTVYDGIAGPVRDDATVTVANVSPTAVFSNDGPVDEGTSFSLALTNSADSSMADSVAEFEFAFDCGDGGGFDSFSTSSTTDCTTHDDGVRVAKGQIRDKDGGITEYTANVIVSNVAPTINSITVTTAPLDISAQSGSTVDVVFSDPAGGNDNAYTCAFDLDFDGSTFTPDQTTNTASYNTCSTSIEYAEAAVYTVKVVVTDKDRSFGVAQATDFIVIYDPSGGFVTGGGWFTSAEGALIADPSAAGKANFGFVSKYQPGANVPVGDTQFQFKAGDLSFHSTAYDWLVVAGLDRAKYKGEGTINGDGNFGFLLTAVDNGNANDTFRIKIWDMDAGDGVVYDNWAGASDDAYDGTTIGGGNIKVHKPAPSAVLAFEVGDANFDGLVDAHDFAILAANFGRKNALYVHGDFDESGTVDFADFLRLSVRLKSRLPAGVSDPIVPAAVDAVYESGAPELWDWF